MKLFDLWSNKLNNCDKQTAGALLNAYYEAETEVYKKLLSEKTQTYTGTVKAFSETYNLEMWQVGGFMDGINTSLVEAVAVDSLDEESELSFTIDWKQLFINMMKAKAEWLWTLEEWDNIYTLEERAAIEKEYKASRQAVSTKVGRNDPCPCGSGKKYKNCCME